MSGIGASGSPPEDGGIALPPAFDRVRHPELRRFMQWYLATRGDRTVMPGKMLDPTQLKGLLARAFYYDYLAAEDDFRLRLAGEEIRAVLPKARRGASLAEVIPGNVLKEVHERYRRIVLEPAVFHGIGRVFFTIGNPGLGERLVVPLADESGVATQIFGATFYDFSEHPWRGQNYSHEDVESTFIPL